MDPEPIRKLPGSRKDQGNTRIRNRQKQYLDTEPTKIPGCGTDHQNTWIRNRSPKYMDPEPTTKYPDPEPTTKIPGSGCGNSIFTFPMEALSSALVPPFIQQILPDYFPKHKNNMEK